MSVPDYSDSLNLILLVTNIVISNPGCCSFFLFSRDDVIYEIPSVDNFRKNFELFQRTYAMSPSHAWTHKISDGKWFSQGERNIGEILNMI